MRRWALGLVLAVAVLQVAEGREPLATLETCLAKLDRVVDSDSQRILAACPDLAPTLAASEVAPWLPRYWSRNRTDNLLSVDGLEELRTLLTRTAALPDNQRTARVSEVAPILARIKVAEAPRGGWFSEFKRWLREVLAPRPQQSDRNWLRRLFGQLRVSQVVLRVIGWACLAAVVVLALAVLINELRVAGVLKPRRSRGAGPRSQGRGAAALTVNEIEQADLALQPALLLELIAARLAQQQRLPPARALTVQELTRVARLPRQIDRAPLAELAGTCEQLRFAERAPPQGVIATSVQHGRELLAALDDADPQLQGAS